MSSRFPPFPGRRWLIAAGGLLVASVLAMLLAEVFHDHHPPDASPPKIFWLLSDASIFFFVAGIPCLPLFLITNHLPHPAPPPGLCQKCGYDRRATPGRCPECGTAAK